MGAHATAHAGGHVRSPISVAWVVLAAVLIGIGLTLLAYWLYFFNLEYSFGALLVLAGGLMLFNPRAGLDHA